MVPGASQSGNRYRVSTANMVCEAAVLVLTLISQRPAGPLAKSINDTMVQVATPLMVHVASSPA